MKDCHDIVSLREAAALLDVFSGHLRRLDRKDEIRAVRSQGGHRGFRLGDVVRFRGRRNKRAVALFARGKDEVSVDFQIDAIRELLGDRLASYGEVYELKSCAGGFDMKSRAAVRLFNLVKVHRITDVVVLHRFIVGCNSAVREMFEAFCHLNGVWVTDLNLRDEAFLSDLAMFEQARHLVEADQLNGDVWKTEYSAPRIFVGDGFAERDAAAGKSRKSPETKWPARKLVGAAAMSAARRKAAAPAAKPAGAESAPAVSVPPPAPRSEDIAVPASAVGRVSDDISDDISDDMQDGIVPESGPAVVSVGLEGSHMGRRTRLFI